ncbi:MAG: hypothetical protein ACK4NW_02105 [Roseinatronobacter sp.]
MPMKLEAVRTALAAGESIMVTRIAEPESKAGTYYVLRQSGKTVSRSQLAKLRDDLEPGERGLLDDEPQTHVLKPQA